MPSLKDISTIDGKVIYDRGSCFATDGVDRDYTVADRWSLENDRLETDGLDEGIHRL